MSTRMSGMGLGNQAVMQVRERVYIIRKVAQDFLAVESLIVDGLGTELYPVDGWSQRDLTGMRLLQVPGRFLLNDLNQALVDLVQGRSSKGYYDGPRFIQGERVQLKVRDRIDREDFHWERGTVSAVRFILGSDDGEEFDHWSYDIRQEGDQVTARDEGRKVERVDHIGVKEEEVREDSQWHEGDRVMVMVEANRHQVVDVAGDPPRDMGYKSWWPGTIVEVRELPHRNPEGVNQEPIRKYRVELDAELLGPRDKVIWRLSNQYMEKFGVQDVGQDPEDDPDGDGTPQETDPGEEGQEDGGQGPQTEESDGVGEDPLTPDHPDNLKALEAIRVLERDFREWLAMDRYAQAMVSKAHRFVGYASVILEELEAWREKYWQSTEGADPVMVLYRLAEDVMYLDPVLGKWVRGTIQGYYDGGHALVVCPRTMSDNCRRYRVPAANVVRSREWEYVREVLGIVGRTFPVLRVVEAKEMEYGQVGVALREVTRGNQTATMLRRKVDPVIGPFRSRWTLNETVEFQVLGQTKVDDLVYYPRSLGVAVGGQVLVAKLHNRSRLMTLTWEAENPYADPCVIGPESNLEEV